MVNRKIRPERTRKVFWAIWVASALVCTPWPNTARAERHYTVRSGDTLAAIAKRYGVPVSAIRAANPKQKAKSIRPGHVIEIPEPGVVYVRPGDTLSSIARTHHVTTRELQSVNRMKRSSMLRAGQKLLLPGYEPAHRRKRAVKRWGRPKRPGVVTLIRAWSSKRTRVRLRKRSGQIHPWGRKVLARLMRSRRNHKIKRPHPRLVKVLALISDHFGGRPIHIISGYRPAGGYTKESSRHTSGRALDIRVRGVSNRALSDYCRRLSNVGCGFYPRSTFVHVDVRRRSAHWVDWSRPGQAPMYEKPSQRERASPKIDNPGEDHQDDEPETPEFPSPPPLLPNKS